MDKTHNKNTKLHYLYSYRIKTTGNPFFTLTAAIAIISLTVIISVLVIGFYQQPDRFGFMYHEAFLIVFLYIYLIDLFLWHLLGRDEILMSTEKILLRKSGKLFKITRVILLEDILSIKYSYNRCSKFESLYLHKGGNIEFVTQKKSFVIGQDISKLAALEVIQSIQKILSEKATSAQTSQTKII